MPYVHIEIMSPALVIVELVLNATYSAFQSDPDLSESICMSVCYMLRNKANVEFPLCQAHNMQQLATLQQEQQVLSTSLAALKQEHADLQAQLQIQVGLLR